MKTDPTFWIIARSSGLVAYALLTASVLAGLVLKSRPFGKLIKPATVTELHRFLALLGLGAIAIHGIALTLDTAVPIPVKALFIPGLSPYRPLWVGVGVVAALMMPVVYASFSQRKRIGMRAWRTLHWFTYAIFGLATVHGIAAGTDSSALWALAFYGACAGSVIGATAWRALMPPVTGKVRREAAPSELAAEPPRAEPLRTAA